MLADLQLHGYSSATQEAYVRAVRQLAAYYDKAPDQLTEEELRQYFLYLGVVRDTCNFQQQEGLTSTFKPSDS
jgi:hypothetical protein